MLKYISLIFVFSLSATFPLHALETLRARYSWPQEKPQVPQDVESMCHNGPQLKQVLNPSTKIIVELGSWLGGSALFFLEQAPQATVIAIDHWKGSLEHQQFPYWAQKLPTLYETFLCNCWDYKDRLIPMRTTTLEGLQELYDLNIYPDLMYVDASHDYSSVIADLEKIYALFPKTTIVGDDWTWFMVRLAVTQFALDHNVEVLHDNNVWRIIT